MERWRRIDDASAADADVRALLAICCGATRWIDRMMGRRPFGTREAARASAHDEWFALSEDDWREAFGHHPRIGDREVLRRRSASPDPAEREQSGVEAASEEVLRALAEANLAYEERFGYIFIVCATGRTAEEMLALLGERLGNDPQTEIRIAAGEHAKICELRLLSQLEPRAIG